MSRWGSAAVQLDISVVCVCILYLGISVFLFCIFVWDALHRRSLISLSWREGWAAGEWVQARCTRPPHSTRAAALPDRDLLHQLRPRRTLILAVILHPVHFQGDIEPLGHFQTKIHISDSESPRNKIAQVCFQIKPCPSRCYSTARV